MLLVASDVEATLPFGPVKVGLARDAFDTFTVKVSLLRLTSPFESAPTVRVKRGWLPLTATAPAVL